MNLMMNPIEENQPGFKFTFQRLVGAVAAASALTREGEGLDKFATDMVEQVNNIGAVSNAVAEQSFGARMHARGYHIHSSHSFEDDESDDESPVSKTRSAPSRRS